MFKKCIFISVIVLASLLLLLSASDIKILGMIIIALMLGLKHGFDADHIVAIDNVTRQLVVEGRASFKTGLFFALGHSTIVFLMTLFIVLGFSYSGIKNTNALEIGAVFGTVISMVFLFLTGTMSLVSLSKMLQTNSTNASSHDHNANSVLAKLFRPVIKTIDRPYKMYFVGFLFGLGFDTATEVALLGMAAANVLNGLSIWYIMLLPMAFALGMITVDSIDAAIMTKVLSFDSKETRFRNYNLIILFIVVMAAYLVAIVEFFSLLNTNVVIITYITDFMSDYSPVIGATLAVVFTLLFIMRFRTRNARKQGI